MDPKELARKVGRQVKGVLKGVALTTPKLTRDRDGHYYVYHFDVVTNVPGVHGVQERVMSVLGKPSKIHFNDTYNWNVEGALVVVSKYRVEVYVDFTEVAVPTKE